MKNLCVRVFSFFCVISMSWFPVNANWNPVWNRSVRWVVRMCVCLGVLRISSWFPKFRKWQSNVAVSVWTRRLRSHLCRFRSRLRQRAKKLLGQWISIFILLWLWETRCELLSWKGNFTCQLKLSARIWIFEHRCVCVCVGGGTQRELMQRGQRSYKRVILPWNSMSLQNGRS